MGLACFFGIHDWHEHEVYTKAKAIKRRGKVLLLRDRVCVRCGKEDRKASGEMQEQQERKRQIFEVEERLRENEDLKLKEAK